MPTTTSAQTAVKPKFKIRRRQVKKVALISVYAFVAVVMVAGMIAPALQ